MSGLHVDSVRKQIGERQILNDIFISCTIGQIIGLLGRNGSGKSCLLKIIFGSMSADNKFVAVDDKKLNSLFNNRKIIHYLPQENYLPNHIKIKKIIQCFCSRENAARIIENDIIKPFLQKKVRQLSGGEKRIVEILLMVHSDVQYILFDEPFNGISPVNIEILKTIIKEHSRDKGLIITDHDYRNVLDISSKVVLMDNGNTKAVKKYSDLVELGYLPATENLF